MEFYLNSERIHKEEKPMFFENFEWETEFLSKNTKFIGQSSSYNITGFSVWSGYLTEEDIASLHTCKNDHSDVDIMSWENVVFDISPATHMRRFPEPQHFFAAE